MVCGCWFGFYLFCLMCSIIFVVLVVVWEFCYEDVILFSCKVFIYEFIIYFRFLIFFMLSYKIFNRFF